MYRLENLISILPLVCLSNCNHLQYEIFKIWTSLQQVNSHACMWSLLQNLGTNLFHMLSLIHICQLTSQLYIIPVWCWMCKDLHVSKWKSDLLKVTELCTRLHNIQFLSSSWKFQHCCINWSEQCCIVFTSVLHITRV